MPNTHDIHIVGSDTSTQKLKFRPRKLLHARVKAGDTINWYIDKDSEVDAIVSIRKKAESAKIWSEEPSDQGTHWKGVISTTVDDTDFYAYLIEWRRGANKYTHDPLISINPSPFDDIFKFLLKFCSGLLVGAVATSLYSKKKKTGFERGK